jgi:hypothetical protein
MAFRLIHPISQLLRSSKTLAELHEGATGEIHAIISKTADAYEEASHLSPACTSAAYHARFLRELVAQDIFRSQQQKVWEDGQPRRKSHHTLYVIGGKIAHENVFFFNSITARVDAIHNHTSVAATWGLLPATA